MMTRAKTPNLPTPTTLLTLALVLGASWSWLATAASASTAVGQPTTKVETSYDWLQTPDILVQSRSEYAVIDDFQVSRNSRVAHTVARMSHTTRIWRDGLLAHVLPGSISALSADGSLAVTGDEFTPVVGGIAVWRTDTGERLRLIAPGVIITALHIRGQSIIATSRENVLEVFDLATGQSQLRWQESHPLPMSWFMVVDRTASVLVTAALQSVELWRLKGGDVERCSFPGRSTAPPALSTSGELVIKANGTGQIELWDTASCWPRLLLEGHEARVTHLRLSADASRLASADEQGRVIYWHLETGRPLQIFELAERLSPLNHRPWMTDKPTALAISAAADRIYVAIDDRQAWLLDPAPGARRRIAESVAARDVRFSDDGLLLHGHISSKGVVTWQPEQSGSLSAAEPAISDIKDLQWSLTGRHLIAKTKASLHVVDTQLGDIRSAVDWTSQIDGAGTILAARTKEDTVEIRRLDDGHTIGKIETDSKISSFRLDSDGQRVLVITLQGEAQLWSTDGELLKTILANSSGLWPPIFDARRQRALTARERAIQVIALETGEVVAMLHEAYASDGTTVAAKPEHSDWLVTRTAKGPWARWNLADLESPPEPMPTAPGGAQKFGFIDAETMYRFTNRGYVEIVDLTSRGLLRKLPHGDIVTVNAFASSPGQSLVAIGGDDHRVTMWDWRTGAQDHTFEHHRTPVRALALSPDGRWRASGDGEGQVLIWRAETGQVVARLLLPGDESWVVVAPDGRWDASHDDQIPHINAWQGARSVSLQTTFADRRQPGLLGELLAPTAPPPAAEGAR